MNDNEGWAAGKKIPKEAKQASIERRVGQGLLLHTMDGGKSWSEVFVKDKELFFHRIYFANTQYGWLFSRDRVYRTNDNGKTWYVVLESQ
jgi:photosystem II stability/assembly factor-like uncharacterized protein